MGCMPKLEWNATGRSKFASSSLVTTECRSNSGWRWPNLLRLLLNVKNQYPWKYCFLLSSSERQINKFLPIWSCRDRTSSSPIYCNAACEKWKKKNPQSNPARAENCPLSRSEGFGKSLSFSIHPFGKSWQKSNFQLPLSHTAAALFRKYFLCGGRGKGKSMPLSPRTHEKKKINNLLFLPFF